MKKKDLLIIAAMSLGIGSGWMVLNENILAQDDGTVPIPVEETELPSAPAQDSEEKDEGSDSQDQSASDQTPSDPVQEDEDQTDPNTEQKEEPSLPAENKETDPVLQEKNEQPVVPAMAAASYRTVSYQAEADRTLNGVVIAAGQNVNMNDLLNKYDFFVIQADAGYGKTNPNFANLADQVVKKTDKKLMMYHEAQSGKDIGSAQMEAYSFYTAIRNYIGKGLPVLRFMNDAQTGPNWADEFMDTLYGLSGVHGIVWTNQEKISSGDWSGYDEKKYAYTTEVTKYETTESGWKEKIRPNHASEAVELYRMYNPNSGEHFYTSAGTERDSLVKAGWRYESIGWTTPVKTNGVAVYRLYNPNAGDHHYTVNEAERDMLIRKGWRYEGVGWYSDNQKQTAIWRAYNPNAKSGAHHFTASRSEYEYLTRIGWRGENIGFYGILPTLVPNSWPGANYIKGEYGYNTSGAKLSGVQKVNSSFYYFSGMNKAMKKGGGLTNVGNETIYVKADGTLQIGQLNTNGGWKWFEPATAYMAKGRFVDIPASYNSGKAKTVYYDGNGNMVYGKYTINGVEYSFDKSDGTLLNPFAGLLNDIQNYINRNKYGSDIWNVSLRVLGVNGDLLYNSRKQQSASLMKLFVMGAIYQNYESMCGSFGKSAIDSNLHAMITWSSNDAWVYLVTCLGYGNYGSGINNLRNWCRSKGYNDTEMQGVPYGNYTSVKDTMNIVTDMANNKLRYSSNMISLLKQQTRTSKIPAGIPGGIVTGNKTGELDNTENDVAIVYAPKGTYILSIMSTSLRSTAHARDMIRTISSMVYNYIQK